jgi:hypothetical protein
MHLCVASTGIALDSCMPNHFSRLRTALLAHAQQLHAMVQESVNTPPEAWLVMELCSLADQQQVV